MRNIHDPGPIPTVPQTEEPAPARPAKCWCGHSPEWDHYRRFPGNGQHFDDVCVGCLDMEARGGRGFNPWHKPSEAR